MKQERNLLKETGTSIREYVESDFESVYSFWQLTSLTNPDRGDSPEVILNTLLLGGKLLLLIAEHTHQVIGTAWMSYDGRRVNLHHFGIHPEYRRCGLGYLLGKECLRYAHQLKTQIRLEVNDANQAAVKLYRKLGFKPFPGYTVYMIRDLGSVPFLGEDQEGL